MNRKIKFRGKTTNDGSWAYGFYVERDGYDYGIIYDEDDVARAVYPKTVGQSTGLEDQKEREIFEGDIIYDERQECNGKIKYDTDGYYSVAGGIMEDLGETHSHIEVIGNIYDQPNLLN